MSTADVIALARAGWTVSLDGRRVWVPEKGHYVPLATALRWLAADARSAEGGR